MGAARIFESAGPQALEKLTAGVERVDLEAGELLFRAGDPSDALFLVLAGDLEVHVGSPQKPSDRQVITVGPGEPVGEMQIVMGGRRSVDVRAVGPCSLARLPRAAVQRALAVQPDALDSMVALIRSRLQRNRIREALPRMFGPLDPETEAAIEQHLRWSHLAPGEILFREGDPADALFLVLNGLVEVFREDGHGGESALGEFGRGESVGEVSLLEHDVRTASVRAVRDTDLARLDRSALDQVTARHPRLAMVLARRVVERVRRRERGFRSQPAVKTIAVLSLSEALPANRLADRLEAPLAAIGACVRLDEHMASRTLGLERAGDVSPEDPHDIRVSAWLDEQEAAQEFALLVVERWSSAWAQRCVRRADVVLLLADATSSPEPGEAESELLHSGVRARPSTVLALLHSGGSEPSGTRRWLDARDLTAHQHVRLDHPGDFARLARRITGHALGVVLGGGAARAAAHLGVLRALDEAGVPIDMIGGTSAGGGIAAQFAMGWNHDRRLAANIDCFIKNNPFKAVTVPVMSLLARHKMDAVARRLYGDRQIEDLWIDWFCVSCDLTTGGINVHRRGPIWRAVRATTSLPGVAVPVADDGHLLVDGGVLDNLPVSVLRRLGAGRVIAVDVSSADPLTVDYDYDETPGAWRLLWRRLSPFAAPLRAPSIIALLTRATTVSSLAARDRALADADLVLQPPVAGYPMLDFSRLEELAESAYVYARGELASQRSGVET